MAINPCMVQHGYMAVQQGYMAVQQGYMLDSLCGWVGWGGLGLIIMTNLNRVRLSCCWVGL